MISGESIGRDVNTSRIVLCGGTDNINGANLSLYGKNSDSLAGVATLQAYNGTYNSFLRAFPTGELQFNNNGTTKNLAMQEDVIPRSGGAVITGTELCRTGNTRTFAICSGTDSNSGGNILLYPNAFADANYRGAIGLYALTSYYVYKAMFLYPDGTWTWSGQPCQIASDQRLKQQISNIDNKLLDAWEDVEPLQFKYNDAVNEKGDNARLHTGYVVQQIDEACQKHNIDISEYGLYCHEEYPQETEEVEVEQADGTKTKETKVIKEASEHYSLRYTETLVVECAYLRRENARLKERLQQHDEYFSNIEKRLQSLENS